MSLVYVCVGVRFVSNISHPILQVSAFINNVLCMCVRCVCDVFERLVCV